MIGSSVFCCMFLLRVYAMLALRVLYIIICIVAGDVCMCNHVIVFVVSDFNIGYESGSDCHILC